MADQDEFNDEYQFADLDAITPDNLDEGEIVGADTAAPQAENAVPKMDNNVKRNAIIVALGFMLFIILYEIVSSIYSGPKPKDDLPVPVMKTPEVPVAQPIQPIMPVVEQPKASLDSEVNQKLSSLETMQNTMRSDLDSANNQLNTMSQNLNTAISKMSELNNLISTLSAKVDQQSRELEQMTTRREQVKKMHHAAKKTSHSHLKYYIQAVIPGRAWLIATNGSTLTVSEGTLIPGYGMVKLIDQNQGRVLTSSGQIIRFSQQDS